MSRTYDRTERKSSVFLQLDVCVVKMSPTYRSTNASSFLTDSDNSPWQGLRRRKGVPTPTGRSVNRSVRCYRSNRFTQRSSSMSTGHRRRQPSTSRQNLTKRTRSRSVGTKILIRLEAESCMGVLNLMLGPGVKSSKSYTSKVIHD